MELSPPRGPCGLNGRLYRLIFAAAHDLSPAVDSRFMASSLELVSSYQCAVDSALATPEKIKIVEAANGDTAETLAARMGFLPQWLDQFLILNRPRARRRAAGSRAAL